MVNRFFRSLGYATSGLFRFFKTERNGQIQGIITMLVIAAGVIFNLSGTEWIAIIFCIVIVLALEMINSAIEKLADNFVQGFHPQVKILKDLAAGAVLLAALGSVVVGTIIFLPKIIGQ